MCETGHNNLTYTVEQKIAWEYLEACLRYMILLKTAYFKHFPAIENFIKTENTVNMCETGHNNLTFSTVE